LLPFFPCFAERIDHENILFGFRENRKNNSALKRQKLFQVRCRALLEFGRTKLSTKKVGNKILMRGEGGPKKVEPNFSK
jgi:hypothetical protein